MAKLTVEKNSYTVEPLYQWDKDQDLVIYGLSLATIPEIHFTNDAMDKAIVRQATMDDAGIITAPIPNSLLQKPYKIRAYVCIYEADTFKSLYTIVIPIQARSMPLDYTITVADDEVYSFNALDNKIDNMLAISTERHDQACSKYEEASGRYTQIVSDVNATVSDQTNKVNTLVENTLKESNTRYNTAVENLNTATNNYNTAINNYNNAVVNYERAEEKLTESADKYDKTYSVLATYNQVKPLFAETIDECVDIRKLYVLPDNHIYAYMLSKEVIQKSEAVPKTWLNGVRLDKTTGAESNAEPYSASDFIPIKPDTNYIISTASNYLLDMGVCYYDKDNNFVGYFQAWEQQSSAIDCTGEWVTLEIPTNAVSFRLRAFHILDGKQLERLSYVTIYRSDHVSSDAYEWVDTGHSFITTDYEERIIELEEKVTDLESRLQAIEGLAQATE